MYKIITAISIALFSVTLHAAEVWQTYSWGPYTLKSPQPLKEHEAKGVDSIVGHASIGKDLELWFDVGWFSNDFKFYESSPHFKRTKKLTNKRIYEYISTKIDGKYVVGFFTKDGSETTSTRYNIEILCKTEKSREMALKIIDSVEIE